MSRILSWVFLGLALAKVVVFVTVSVEYGALEQLLSARAQSTGCGSVADEMTCKALYNVKSLFLDSVLLDCILLLLLSLFIVGRSSRQTKSAPKEPKGRL
jgi:hypothetical protein